MSDPLAEIVTLLQPSLPSSKVVSGAGRWRVRRDDVQQPFYCAVLEGACRLTLDHGSSVVLVQGDFVLIPAASAYMMSSLEPSKRDASRHALPNGEFRVGDLNAKADVRLLIGYCVFASADANLLVSLLPELVHIRGIPRLATVMELVRDEIRSQRPARDVLLARLLEVLLLEAFRSSGTNASPGLLNGLADDRLAVAIRRMHERPAKPWTVPQLAKESALSRSTFFDRFSRAVGMPPMEYLLNWRMALAKVALERGKSVAAVAQTVGYSSASTFSVAFTRHVGTPPSQYAKAS